MDTLDSKLPEYLKYHSTEHTEYVVQKAEYLATKEKKSKSDIFLLKVAALYHDIGFTKTHIEHEKEGCKIARRELKKYNFSKIQIDKICGMIMATRIPQQPKTHLEEILADADLEYLGTKDFNKYGERLFEELKHFNPKLSRKQWNDIQIKFLSSHQYHTNFCLRYKEHRKRKNLDSLK